MPTLTINASSYIFSVLSTLNYTIVSADLTRPPYFWEYLFLIPFSFSKKCLRNGRRFFCCCSNTYVYNWVIVEQKKRIFDLNRLCRNSFFCCLTVRSTFGQNMTIRSTQAQKKKCAVHKGEGVRPQKRLSERKIILLLVIKETTPLAAPNLKILFIWLLENIKSVFFKTLHTIIALENRRFLLKVLNTNCILKNIKLSVSPQYTVVLSKISLFCSNCYTFLSNMNAFVDSTPYGSLAKVRRQLAALGITEADIDRQTPVEGEVVSDWTQWPGSRW